jgi:hypothetical protein
MSSRPVESWSLDQVRGVVPHRHILQDVGLEVFFVGHSLLFAFSTAEDCSKAQALLEAPSTIPPSPSGVLSSVAPSCSLAGTLPLDETMKLWLREEIP